MDQARDQIIAANEALSREVNEGIDRGQWPGEEDRVTAYRCECAQAGCNRLIELTPREYDGVRAESRHFLVVPGHERPDVETVIKKTSGYLVVEKHGTAGAVADATDPRA
jgi:hypothetical protein